MSTTHPDTESAHPALRVIVMGVSGVGKTVVGRVLAERLGVPFFDADDYHPPANVAKMAAGRPLDDGDRLPWLERLNTLLHDQSRCVLACSALRRTYRDTMTRDIEGVRAIHLVADFDTIAGRMAARTGHFMSPTLLRSQFDALEAPDAASAVTIDASQSLETVVAEALRKIGRASRNAS